jgi:hypothetical protein
MTQGTTTCIAALLLLSPLMLAQQAKDTSKTPNSSSPIEVIPSQPLIAWTWMQEPQPIPHSLPPVTEQNAGPPVPQSAPSNPGIIIYPSMNQDVTEKPRTTEKQ